jgi:hypothetical protein
MPNAIETSGIGKRYGAAVALEEVSAIVPAASPRSSSWRSG